MRADTEPLVSTVPERCRVCYTCVRECPARAIRISEGQAEVLVERCIGCGNCVLVCSQDAKKVRNCVPPVRKMLAKTKPVIACLAPSWPAEFPELSSAQLGGMLRALGFALVTEVAFGADLVAQRYRELLDARPGERFVATTCPAIVGYVERYHPELVPSLAPIVSPMVAMARVLRREQGPEARIVFIGPCLAKKDERSDPDLREDEDAVLTFAELRRMFYESAVRADEVTPWDFDPPLGGMGALFPISRGMLQAAGIVEDLAAGEIVSAEGREAFVEAIREFEAGGLGARLLEVLCCEGCIMGAGTTTRAPVFQRRARVASHVRQEVLTRDREAWQAAMVRHADLDLSRAFRSNDQRLALASDEALARVLKRMGKQGPKDELNCGACGYATCREHATAVVRGLAESEMCLPFTIEQLRRSVEEVERSHAQVRAAQEALVQSEKLASMGQLAAGIAHEVNNPLGVVLMYAHILLDEAAKDSPNRPDLELIAEQADRCRSIVAGLLNFARQNKIFLDTVEPTEVVSRALHSVPLPANVTLQREHSGERLGELDPDQMAQVIANLCKNAVDAMEETGGVLTVRSEVTADQVRFEVEDTGCGVPEENIRRLYEPFFTTKEMGRGTGLGLAITYGIVKMHRGEIRVRSNTDPAQGPTGTTFTVIVPRSGPKE